ncbi:hypothetical protein AXG93_2402s1160 [Marchantia polymorpha subsp. ruderalis]|uniref:F-box domain-containing protein n=1 Tax=Marchantia polymorpha subsp. ruderalis TaxID=1480154 RepID=A0A176VTI1_MARPO|nr:hypothetical protein AXG93_2402s1160 [Marchantia polymorpha subsp. ruderalis]
MESRTFTSPSTSVSLSHPRVKKLCKNKDEGSKDEAMDETVWSNLPAAMFVKIMQFLPPASLLQQRTLSKWVYQATSSVSFNHLYRKQRNRVNKPWLLLVQTYIQETFKIIKAYDFCLEKWHRIPMVNLRIEFDVVASAGGLLLCESKPSHKLYMCNPLTRTWRELPPTQKQRWKTVVGVVHVQEDPADVDGDAFKVVVAGGVSSTLVLKFDIDLKTWTWLPKHSLKGMFLNPRLELDH